MALDPQSKAIATGILIRRLIHTNCTIHSDSSIETVASSMLDQRELRLCSRFAKMMKSGSAIEPLVLDILPVYYHDDQTLDPQGVYRTLMYVYLYAFSGDSRGMIAMAGQHIEGCLQCIGGYNQPLGVIVKNFYRRGVLTEDLARKLWLFNRGVNVPTKHLWSIKALQTRVDERTFSYFQAACVFMMMRKLSISIFSILRQYGVVLPEDWKEFKKSWLLEGNSAE